MQHGALALAAILAITSVSSAVIRAGSGDPAAAAAADRVARGRYLVQFGSCHDCHTPWTMGLEGLAPDMIRALSGHPGDIVFGPPPALNQQWAWAGTATNTAFVGPWGISFTANLTPDPETGLGRWTEEMFVMALKTGRHEGKGRPILPPMPVKYVGSLTDDDLKAVFAYLQSLPPVRNRVPSPIDPLEEP
jgi:mono/diheme cytochrome c family protein